MTNWFDPISALANCITALAAFGAGIAAFKGLRAWREQLASNTEHDVAYRLLRQMYSVRDRIRFSRRPIKTFPEMREALKATGRDPVLASKVSEIAVYEVRWKDLQEALSSMHTDLLDAEALWGNIIVDTFRPLTKCVAELHSAIDSHVRYLSRNDSAGTFSEHKEEILYDEGEDDKYSGRLAAAISQIENFLRPRLLTHGRRRSS